MIPIPTSINKYFKIINDNTLIFRPALSKILLACVFTFGLPAMTGLICFADGIQEDDTLVILVFLVITAFCLWFGYSIALPGLRERITFDIKNRIIRTEYGRHHEIKDTFSFDDIVFKYESDFIQISTDSFSSHMRIFFIDKETQKPRYELALNKSYDEYEDMLFFLQELCEPNKKF